MKTQFSPFYHQKFLDHMWAKKAPGKYDSLYLKKTWEYLRYIQWIPGLLMVWVGNSLSMNAWKKTSDIDLLIVTQENRMWLVRILVTIIFSITKQRKTHSQHAGKFCLSFFCTDKNLNFWNFTLWQDIYLYFWILHFKPILNYNKTYELFLQENKKWADFSHYSHIIENNKTYIKVDSKMWTSHNKFLTIVNKLLKKLFIQKTLTSAKKLWNPYGIIISDHMLKFHNHDIRKKIRDELL